MTIHERRPSGSEASGASEASALSEQAILCSTSTRTLNTRPFVINAVVKVKLSN